MGGGDRGDMGGDRGDMGEGLEGIWGGGVRKNMGGGGVRGDRI